MTVLKHYKTVTACGDIMFVNGIPFFMTNSRNLKFGTVEALTGTKTKQIMMAIENVCNIYSQGGFSLAWLLMEGQFEPMRGEMVGLGIRLNEVAEDEHVGEVEQYIRTIKEQCRSTCNVLPFKSLPRRMVIEMVR